MAKRFAGVVGCTVLLTLLSACSTEQPAGDEPSAALTREALPPNALAREAQLPPTPESTTTTSLLPAPVDPIEADRAARALIRRVAAAADEAFAESGTYDVDRTTISSLAEGVEVISLEEAALATGVVYDPFGQRVTLHYQSSSGRWFCLDLSAAGRDYGFGDTFPSSLATCTDGVRTAGWGDAFSPTGPDEAAIAGLWDSLASALQAGDPAAAHDVFSTPVACPLSRLETVWPRGVSLLNADEFTLEGVSVADRTAVSDVTLGTLPASSWRAELDGATWSIAVDPCRELSALAAARTNAAARELLEAGLFAVRSVFVVEQDFAFGSTELGAIDADLVWVEIEALEFGRLSYTGTRQAGVITARGAETFLCAIESSTAATRYGEGDTATEVASVEGCAASTPGG